VRRARPEGKGHARPDTCKHRVILTEHSEVDSESRRKPAVSIARATAWLDTHTLFVAVVVPSTVRPPDFRGRGRPVLLAGLELTATGGRAHDKEARPYPRPRSPRALWPTLATAAADLRPTHSLVARKLRQSFVRTLRTFVLQKPCSRAKVEDFRTRCYQWRRRELNPRPRSRERWRLRA
jgi:hypothetical protein